MGNISTNFDRSEFACSDKCGFANPTQALVETVQAIRDAVGMGVHISSACRCGPNNRKWGGKPNSGHLTGEAADIYVKGWGDRQLGGLIKQLHAAGKLPHLRYCYLIGGKTRTAVHVGVDEKPRSRIFAF